MGLPGSGKTHFRKTELPEDCIVVDEVPVSEYNPRHYQPFWSYSWNELCYDGLVLTIEDLTSLIQKFERFCKKETIKFVIHYWKEDRKQCLVNDKCRAREPYNSKATILGAKFDMITPEMMGDKCQIIYHDVHKVNDLEKILPEEDYLDGQKILKSDTWTKGGRWGNYRGETGDLIPDEEPDFTQLDEVLEKLCPDISFLGYKKLVREVVKIHTYTETDYYGGYTEEAFKYCVVSELYNKLKEYENNKTN